MRRAGLALVALLGACRAEHPKILVRGGNPDEGRRQIAAFGCGGCHAIPGVARATGMVGPPLAGFARRTYIAGRSPNTAPALVQWIKSPQAIAPGTAMPDLGVDDEQARDIAAYLYTLH